MDMSGSLYHYNTQPALLVIQYADTFKIILWWNSRYGLKEIVAR